jgi:hypothetical protein
MKRCPRREAVEPTYWPIDEALQSLSRLIAEKGGRIALLRRAKRRGNRPAPGNLTRNGKGAVGIAKAWLFHELTGKKDLRAVAAPDA